MKRLFQILVASLAAVVFAEEVRAQFALMTSTADGGGTIVSGGAFSINGTVGQPDAAASGSAGFSFTGGYWPAVLDDVIEPTVPEVRLNIVIAAGEIQVRWPVELTNGILEATTELPSAGWEKLGQATNVDGASRYVILNDKDHPVRFFRLHLP